MVPLRKERAGSCNLGYTWPEDGSVVEVTPAHAELLLAVPDGDFNVVDTSPHAEIEVDPELDLADRAIEEPAPTTEFSEAPAPRRAAKKTAAKKAPETGAPAPVEE